MADVNRQIAGARSRAMGEIFERWITSACNYYQREGYAVIEKTPEPTKILGKPDRFGRFKACYTKQAQPDFKGALCDGSCIIFDAKHTDKDKIRQEVVTETQWETFDKYEAMNAKCYVVVSLGLTEFYRVPWKDWKRMKELFGHKYMSYMELEQYRVPDRSQTIMFLEGVEVRNEN